MNVCSRWLVGLGRLGLGLCFATLGVGGCDGASGRDTRAQNVPAQTGSGLRLQSVLGAEADNRGFQQAAADTAIVFPADHGPHPGFRSEWWYLTLVLKDVDGNAYGGQFTLFRQALQAPAAPEPNANPWRSSQTWLAHLAMTDVAGSDHRFAERLSRGHTELAGARAQPFAAWLEDWRLASSSDAFLPLQLTAIADDFGWSLTLDGARPLVLQGDQGFSAKGPGQGSHYYSATRLEVQGTLAIDSRSVTVQGTGWLDREWSTSVLSARQVGWDWFALQLDDGRDLMMFNLRRDDCSRDPFDHGVLVSADGGYQKLQAADYDLRPLAIWRGPRQEALQPAVDRCADAASAVQGWPLEWSVRVGEEQFLLRAAVSDQRMQTRSRSGKGWSTCIAPSSRRLGLVRSTWS
ncbi:MAG: lipocalin-like domain-containing protein [Pseudomonadales bacterium]